MKHKPGIVVPLPIHGEPVFHPLSKTTFDLAWNMSVIRAPGISMANNHARGSSDPYSTCRSQQVDPAFLSFPVICKICHGFPQPSDCRSHMIRPSDNGAKIPAAVVCERI